MIKQKKRLFYYLCFTNISRSSIMKSKLNIQKQQTPCC